MNANDHGNANENPHPTGARLDAVASGDADAAATAHVAACEECAAYVTRLRREIEAFAEAERKSPDGFVERVARARAKAVAPIRVGRWAAGATSVLALAAGLLLVVHAPQTSSTGDTPTVPSVGPIRFKGGAQVAVIIDRKGAQSRETGILRLAPGDRIRAEIALDHDDDVTAGVLTDSGEWALLQAPAFLAAGTHLSERSIAFDAPVDEGWIVVGRPEAVAQARNTRDFGAVQTIRIHAVAP